jgi:hypothetical protein
MIGTRGGETTRRKEKKVGCSPFGVGGHNIGEISLKSGLRGRGVSAKGFSTYPYRF